MNKKEKILIVDDESETAEIFEEYFHYQGFQVETASNGPLCLERVKSFGPDIILLDIRMPEMSGLEVLEAVNPRESDIAVIMFTAICDLKTAVQSLQAGAFDYLVKPANLEEAAVVVDKALEKRRLTLENKRLALDLTAKNKKLMELDRLKNLLMQFIVHDLRNPLAGVDANLQLLQRMFKDSFPEDAEEILAASCKGVAQIMEMVTSILTVTKLKDGGLELELRDTNINTLVIEAVGVAEGRLKSKVVLACQDLSSDVPQVQCDRELMGRVIGNLLSNSINNTPSRGTIMLKTMVGGGRVCVKVQDTGMGISKEFLPKIFDKYAHAQHRAETGQKYNAGLGLTFCKMVVEAHGGEIRVESEEGKGSEFTFFLPAGTMGKD